MHTWPGECLHSHLGAQGRGSSHGGGMCLVVLYWSVLLCEVLCLLHGSYFLCVVVFWHLLMSSPVSTQSLINRWDQCVWVAAEGSDSYLI